MNYSLGPRVDPRIRRVLATISRVDPRVVPKVGPSQVRARTLKNPNSALLDLLVYILFAHDLEMVFFTCIFFVTYHTQFGQHVYNGLNMNDCTAWKNALKWRPIYVHKYRALHSNLFFFTHVIRPPNPRKHIFINKHPLFGTHTIHKYFIVWALEVQ